MTFSILVLQYALILQMDFYSSEQSAAQAGLTTVDGLTIEACAVAAEQAEKKLSDVRAYCLNKETGEIYRSYDVRELLGK